MGNGMRVKQVKCLVFFRFSVSTLESESKSEKHAEQKDEITQREKIPGQFPYFHVFNKDGSPSSKDIVVTMPGELARHVLRPQRKVLNFNIMRPFCDCGFQFKF